MTERHLLGDRGAQISAAADGASQALQQERHASGALCPLPKQLEERLNMVLKGLLPPVTVGDIVESMEKQRGLALVEKGKTIAQYDKLPEGSTLSPAGFPSRNTAEHVPIGNSTLDGQNNEHRHYQRKFDDKSTADERVTLTLEGGLLERKITFDTPHDMDVVGANGQLRDKKSVVAYQATFDPESGNYKVVYTTKDGYHHNAPAHNIEQTVTPDGKILSVSEKWDGDGHRGWLPNNESIQVRDEKTTWNAKTQKYDVELVTTDGRRITAQSDGNHILEPGYHEEFKPPKEMDINGKSGTYPAQLVKSVDYRIRDDQERQYTIYHLEGGTRITVEQQYGSISGSVGPLADR